ncbi:ATP-binding protein [Chromobacterium alticapitis]|uniref:ATP-binding protein n=1 Tax=Chromobacterium alticapitis TaxID=2073169 RepID=A0A2S5DFV4_9NEIS|nr:ATP-binding protein [Chromobacterium alticapitis]POZ61985.1 ATP-binding protein [Chromobacterium alticapitis]
MDQENKNYGNSPVTPLELRFSHNVIEHLGLKLYQNKPTNVLAELVSNSWDANARNVWIDLSTDADGSPTSVAVADNGVGMDEQKLVDNYLVVGKAKRDPSDPGGKIIGGRAPMGRKGIGKLAPFGVAKEVDLISVSSGLSTWLRFNYDDMLGEEHGAAQSLTVYRPKEIARNVPLAQINANDADGEKEVVKRFIERIEEKGAGTLVLARKLTLRRPISPQQLMESLGRRFTVTLAREDFKVEVNEVLLGESHAFPTWELRIPPEGVETTTVNTRHGPKEVKCWVGFVAEASWPQEQAGVGVYAHGKIAQDRPFFFGNKGNEIFSRYMYGVVEADWVDELSYDAISTDRTSIDWEDAEFDEFKKWGGEKVKAWINAYQRHRKEAAKAEDTKLVDKVIENNTDLKVRDSEKEHLVELLADITPRLGKESEDKEKLVEAAVRAWVHEPARKLIKKLWEEASLFDADKFSLVVQRLVDQLVPESLSLAVVFAQRVYALTQLENHIMLGKETQLQTLIEEFPWILDNSYEKFFARRALKTICDEAEKEGLIQARASHVSTPTDYTKPDFVFLSNADDANILVVELKGPDATASWPEFHQLHSYMTFLQSRFSKSNVTGILVARNFDEGIEKQKSNAMTYKKWQDLLLRSRRDHMDLLAALLSGTDADANDARIQQICELGGKPVRDFLVQMSDNNTVLSDLVKKLGPVKS